MTNYTWSSSEAAAKLVLAWSLSNNDGDVPDCSSDGKKVSFNDAYFRINTEATTSDNKTIAVQLRCLGSGNSGLWLVYDHFATSFEHDPELGVVSGLSAGAVAGIVIGILIVAALIAVAVVLIMRRRKMFLGA